MASPSVGGGGDDCQTASNPVRSDMRPASWTGGARSRHGDALLALRDSQADAHSGRLERVLRGSAVRAEKASLVLYPDVGLWLDQRIDVLGRRFMRSTADRIVRLAPTLRRRTKAGGSWQSCRIRTSVRRASPVPKVDFHPAIRTGAAATHTLSPSPTGIIGPVTMAPARSHAGAPGVVWDRSAAIAQGGCRDAQSGEQRKNANQAHGRRLTSVRHAPVRPGSLSQRRGWPGAPKAQPSETRTGA